MALGGKLPCELMEEILSRVPPESLVIFRIVSKQWNALFNDKTFINNHKKTFRFIITTKSKIYSVSINPKIEMLELTLDIPGLESKIPKKLLECNGFLLCEMEKGIVVWNPWLRQTRLIESEVNQSSLQFNGIGYDDDDDNGTSGYKTLASYRLESDPTKTIWKTHDFESSSWNHELGSGGWSSSEGGGESITIPTLSVSLNGDLYWVTSHKSHNKTIESLFFLINFDFSTKKFYKFCYLPCGDDRSDALVLRVFMGDRFSLLKQCHVTKKIEIWVTKNKIHKWFGRDVEWMKFMEVSIPNLPDLQTGSHSKPSYFIEDKRLVVCSCDKTGQAWIYVFGENKLISKIQLGLVVDAWHLHCTIFPSLVSVPEVKETKQTSQV